MNIPIDTVQGKEPSRFGFTLIELLVVIAIMAILMGLLISAVVKVRSASDKVTCSNNFRQIGLAFIQFHNQHNVFPSNGGWDGKQQIPSASGALFTPSTFDYTTNQHFIFGAGLPQLSARDQTGSWGYAILPYIEQGALYDRPQWDASVGVYICPSRRSARATPTVSQDMWGKYESGGWSWARTDYGVNLGAFDNRPNCHSTTRFTDGLSNSILLGERAYDVAVQKDNWYFDESFFLGGSKGTSRGAPGLSRDGRGINYKDNWGSAHTGGVYFLFGDGGVRLMSFETDVDTMISLMTPDGNEVKSSP